MVNFAAIIKTGAVADPGGTRGAGGGHRRMLRKGAGSEPRSNLRRIWILSGDDLKRTPVRISRQRRASF